VLIAHEERLLDGLWGNGRERGTCLLDLRQDDVHRFHLTNTERAPAPADETEH